MKTGAKQSRSFTLSYAWVVVLLLAFLIQLAGSEDHVNSPVATPEAALTLSKQTMFNMDYQAVGQRLCEYIS